MKLDEQKIYEELLNGNEEALEELMIAYYNMYIKWANLEFWDLPNDILEDVFIDTLATFYQQVLEGKFILKPIKREKHQLDKKEDKRMEIKSQTKRASIKTYIFLLCKRQLINARNHSNMKKRHELTLQKNIQAQNLVIPSKKLCHQDQEKAIALGLTYLSKTYKNILMLRYFENYSMEAIAKKLNLKNAIVARVMKYRAEKKLKTILTKIFNYKKGDLL